MANKESSIVQDTLFNSVARYFDSNEDSLFSIDFTDIHMPIDCDPLMSPLDLLTLNYSEELLSETISIDQFLSNPNIDIPDNISIPSSTPEQQYLISNDSLLFDQNYESNISLSFINPPESFYHVRYLSEITNSPPKGNLVETRIKTKKNISGRYLKGIRGRYITIALPSTLSDHSNLYIRVTRLTVPYQDISFIHPYPLYSYVKKQTQSNVISQGSSIYYKITKEDVCSGSKQFPNIILTRSKQSDLKKMNNLYSFDNSNTSHPFSGNNMRSRIALYQLKKCQLDFRLVIKSEKTDEFIDTKVFCRSDELIEAEGIEWKKLST